MESGKDNLEVGSAVLIFEHYLQSDVVDGSSIATKEFECDGVKYITIDEPVESESVVSNQQHQCCLCNKILISETNLAEHLQSHEEVKSEVVIITSGDDKTDISVPVQACNVNLLDDHMASKKASEDLKEEESTSSSEQGSILVGHVVTEMNECPVCNKKFTRRDTCERHLKSHLRSAACSVCDKVYASPSGLAKHMKKHLEVESAASTIKPHQCAQCKKTFRTLENLQTHIRTHTGEKPFPCVECGKCFSQKANLQHHMRTHTGERPYTCSYCSKSFTQVANLKAHVRIHTGEKPYVCTECGTAYHQLSSLNSHKKACEKNKAKKLNYSTIMAPKTPIIREVKYNRKAKIKEKSEKD